MKGYNELVKLVNMSAATGGLDVTNEAICEYQDMIGHSSIEQLNELANGPQKETFYRVYGVAYGTIAAIKFYCENSKHLAGIIEEHDEARIDAEEQAARMERTAQQWKEDSERWEARYNEQFERREEAEKAGCRIIDEKSELQKQLEEAQREIVELKVKLFDLMNK